MVGGVGGGIFCGWIGEDVGGFGDGDWSRGVVILCCGFGKEMLIFFD